MNDERYSIIYSSRTGNTRLLAEAIRESLPADLCNHFGTDEAGAVESEKLYVGFWTDKGTADEAALALLKRLKNKKIFLFGTAGFGESEVYFQKVLDRVKRASTRAIQSSALICAREKCPWRSGSGMKK